MVLFGISEEERQEIASDGKFVQIIPYFFELEVPKRIVDGNNVFLIPLVINPEFLSMDEPFTLNRTQTQQAGLFVEENGIIERMIRLRGHTGFKPRRNLVSPLKIKDSQNRSFSREVKFVHKIDLSGQRHFQYLQDNVFRTYADLKKDPSTSAETKMFFHNLKDDEHWRVIPMKFSLERDKDRPLLYRYDIELLVVESLDVRVKDVSEEKSLLDKAKDTVKDVRRAVRDVQAAIQEISNIVSEINDFVNGIGNIVNDISNFISNVAGFVDGVVDTIQAPFNTVARTLTRLDRALEEMKEAGESIPSEVKNSFRRMQDAIERIGAHPEAFETPVNALLRTIQGKARLRGTPEAFQEAANSAPGSLREAGKRTTALKAGDQLRSTVNPPSSAILEFRAAQEHVVSQDDTLQSLAARYLGDARLWRQLAALNDLKAPYISEQSIPGTVRIGEPILVPTDEQPPDNLSLLATLGSNPNDTPANRILGYDLELLRSPSGRGLLELKIDQRTDATDLKVISGIDNLRQAITTRAITEQGTNVMFQNLGYRRIIGVGAREIDRGIIAFRLSEAINADPRINAVLGVDLDEDASPDTILADIDAEVIGFLQPTVIRTRID